MTITDTMTTAQLRNAADTAASACDWILAADCMDAAIARHPFAASTRSAMYQADIAQMRSRAASWRSTAADAAA